MQAVAAVYTLQFTRLLLLLLLLPVLFIALLRHGIDG